MFSLIDKVTHLIKETVHLRIRHGTKYKHTINTQGQKRQNKQTKTPLRGEGETVRQQERERTQYNSRESNKIQNKCGS